MLIMFKRDPLVPAITKAKECMIILASGTFLVLSFDRPLSTHKKTREKNI
jgi:hypothetical protein